jgi:hypothetical protein
VSHEARSSDLPGDPKQPHTHGAAAPVDVAPPARPAPLRRAAYRAHPRAMAGSPSADAQVQFLVQLQRLLHEGLFAATYKYALLLAVADVCVEEGDDSGGEQTLTTGALAERFIRVYWRQALPYPGPSGAKVLVQNKGSQVAVLTAIERAHTLAGGSLARLRNDAAVWTKLRGDVRSTIEKMPLWKLQVVGGQPMDFLYPNVGAGHAITLRPGIAACFRRFHELVEDLVRGAWVRFVREVPANQPLLGQVTEVSIFLFGATRAEVEACRPILAEAQRGRCFYCDGALRSERVVDHFIPWSRYSVDLGHNYVLAHAGCNGSKADRLAAPVHLARWCVRNDRDGDALAAAFSKRGVVQDLAVTRRVAGWAYGQAEATAARVWVQNDELVGLGRGWRKLLATAA